VARQATVPISLFVLREVLGLPEHLKIDAVTQTDDDRRSGTMRVMVSGSLCPEVAEGAPVPEISIVYKRLETGQAHVLSIHGLDT
jgi:hypothetical protein